VAVIVAFLKNCDESALGVKQWELSSASMPKPRCPGQDTRYWKPEDIFEVPCAKCGRALEFFKSDLRRRFPHCGAANLNPRNDLSCAAWCKAADECLTEVGRPIPEKPE
jgi:hypothetical protein